ncbi:MAG: nitrite reductase/ring-hydroxylating ferredoxin subunit [Glaciecola sp.]|jgi:nitrite reductase/ring-hydroxylating ferredoxin subunit|uniref:Rieske (2Fe-2S) protein n=1 Tax=Congregibacter sp. TaxID=2744308 RepID=UPI0039E428F3
MNDSEMGPAILSMPDNSSQSVTLEGRSLILAKHREDLFLYENNCPHANETMDPLGGSISDESGDLLRCQRHGAEFLTTTGECVAGPCIGEALSPVAFTVAGEQIYLD